jgi:DNA-binding response OmpR family regulator
VETQASASVTVLLVDDDLLVQDVIRSALEEGGFEVVCAASGKEAMAILNDSAAAIQALVTDVNLGSTESGWDVARYGRELSVVLPVVYVSGDSAHDWPAHGVPGSIVVQKPFAPAQIVTAVATVLNDAPPSPPSDAESQ